MHVLWNFCIQFKVNQITLYRFLNYESIDCNYVSGSEAWKKCLLQFFTRYVAEAEDGGE